MSDYTGSEFRIIAKAKQALLDSTNIESSPDEMKVLNDFLHRCWQMGWLDKYYEHLPFADVVEVRHGKWSHDYIKDGIEYNDWFNLHCSVCGETQRDAWGKWNYCPYCGAKMDEEEQENE